WREPTRPLGSSTGPCRSTWRRSSSSRPSSAPTTPTPSPAWTTWRRATRPPGSWTWPCRSTRRRSSSRRPSSAPTTPTPSPHDPPAFHLPPRRYQAPGKLDGALPLYVETLKLIKAKLGPDHPSSLTSFNNLAEAYQAAGKLDRALPLYEETLKLKKAKLGPDH